MIPVHTMLFKPFDSYLLTYPIVRTFFLCHWIVMSKSRTSKSARERDLWQSGASVPLAFHFGEQGSKQVIL